MSTISGTSPSSRKRSRSRSNSSHVERGPYSGPDTSFGQPWHQQKVFSRFWQHYSSLMLCTHASILEHAAYADALTPASVPPRATTRRKCNSRQRRQQARGSPGQHLPHQHNAPLLCRKHKQQRRRAKRKLASLQKKGQMNPKSSHNYSRTGHHSSRTGQDDSDLDLNARMRTGMHLNEEVGHGQAPEAMSAEFLSFVKESLRHREEWKNKKTNILKEREASNLMGRDSLDDVEHKEHPDSIRSREMLELYGEAAPRLHAMETAVQLTFERVATIHHTKLWPNIPISVIFDDTA